MHTHSTTVRGVSAMRIDRHGIPVLLRRYEPDAGGPDACGVCNGTGRVFDPFAGVWRLCPVVCRPKGARG